MNYTPSGNPATGSEGLSALMRAEFAAIAAAFAAVPRITTAGNFDTIFVQVGSFSFTLPATAGTLALVADVAAEAAARAAAVTSEATARAAADTTLTTAISSEATTRAAADALLAPKTSPVFSGTATFAFAATTPSAGVTAHAGGGQASATQLTAGLNRITVVASPADSVKLPAAVAGLVVEVVNETGVAAAVFAAGTDSLNGQIPTVAFSLGNVSLGYFRCPVNGFWFGGRIL